MQHSTCVSSKDPDDALRSVGSVGFVARPWAALFWSGWGWVVFLCVCVCVCVCACACTCVRVLSVGAFGVTEVSGLRVLLCEAAALHPPAAPLPWCGASVYLKAECKFTTLVKTTRSQNTQAQCDKHCEAKHETTTRRSAEPSLLYNSSSCLDFQSKTLRMCSTQLASSVSHLLHLITRTWKQHCRSEQNRVNPRSIKLLNGSMSQFGIVLKIDIPVCWLTEEKLCVVCSVCWCPYTESNITFFSL